MNYTAKVNCISVTLTLISISDYVVTPCIMCVQYIGGIFNTLGDTMSTSRGYHEYIGGCSAHRGTSWCMWGIPWVHRGVFSTSGDIMMHVGDTMSTSGDVQYIGVFKINWKAFINLLPHIHHDIPRCTYDIPRCTHGIPLCTQHSPMYSWYPPMYSCYPPM